ncbi:MAG TPA: hypothetical protein VNH11_23500 [Pirellulales bacterium]|nr:hypothetical protein [Pirellulales bacterium]
MQQASGAERRKQLVRTMNALGDLTLKVDELSRGHLDNSAAAIGFAQAIVSIKAARDALQSQYNQLFSGGG